MVWRWAEREITYVLLHCHHRNDFCIKVGSDESHFNVSLIVRDKVSSTNHNPLKTRDVPPEVPCINFTRMPGESCRRRLRSSLLFLCDVFRVLINSLVF